MNIGDYLLENLFALREWLGRHRGGFGKVLAIASVALAVPLIGLLLLPDILSMLAPPLDTSQDLYAINRPIAFTFLDSQGRTVGHRGAVVGDRLKLEEMPAYLPAAFIAMEDRRFYQHGGIDIRGLVRAMWTNFRAHHVVQGGSTITQQTAKIVFLSPKRTYARKLEELVDAESLEKSLSKQEILQLYLNRIYLGSGAYGVDGAARVYFGKSAREVTLPEAAMLATLTRAPTVFSPRRDLAAAQARAARVLNAMVKTGAISPEQAEEAKAHPAMVTDRSSVDARNFFLDTAADEALKLASVNGQVPNADLTVHTTLEPELQEAARHALNRVLAKYGARAHASEGAVVVMKTDGAVGALIGGRDYDESVFNRATQAKRQPGSAFKPFVYLAAVENGISPWDMREDGPVDIDGWAPTNYGGRSYGTITLASALAHSVNTITASLAQEVGVTSVMEAAQRLGITSPLVANASLALGTSEVTPLELTTAYAAFASGGVRVYPYLVTEVDDQGGRVLYKRQPPAPTRVIASHVDRDLTEMLYGVIAEGTGRSAALAGHEAAGKTGTTQDYHDAWFVGFTTDYVTGVWIGNDDSSPMKNVTGGSLPAQVWKSVMTFAEKDLPGRPLDKSPPQPANDENGIITAESGSTTIEGSDGITSMDDEAGGESRESGDEGSGPRGRGGDQSWWDWLFGREGGSRASAAPHAARPPAVESAPPPRPPDNSPEVIVPDNQAPPAAHNYDQPRDYSPPPPPQTYAPPAPREYAPPVERDYAPQNDNPPPPPPRGVRPPPPPPDAGDDEGSQHPDNGDDNGN
jgi:penicillin-binding protein 1A